MGLFKAFGKVSLGMVTNVFGVVNHGSSLISEELEDSTLVRKAANEATREARTFTKIAEQVAEIEETLGDSDITSDAIKATLAKYSFK